MLMKKCYNLQETLTALFESYVYEPYIDSLSIKLKNYLDDAVPDGLYPQMIKFASYADESFTYDDYIAEMLDGFYNRFATYYAISTYDDSEKVEEVKKFYWRFLNVLNATYPRFKKIIKNYKDYEDHLMDQLERSYTDLAGNSGSSTNRFNDTPQNGGDYSDDNHTTNINQIDSSASSNLRHNEKYTNEYIIERLNKIRDELQNLFTIWENEVAKILWRE